MNSAVATSEPPASPPAPPRIGTDRLTRGFAIANLAAQIGIIVTGGAVRLTGSGLGCSQWPMCEPGSFTPVFHEENALHGIIEFGNRTLTGVLGIIALGLVLTVFRREPTRSRPLSLRLLTVVPLAGIALQALVGGVTVRFDLHPGVVGVHMGISLLLVAFSAYLLHRLDSPDAPPVGAAPRPLRLVTGALVVVAAVLLALGIVTTGSGPHSGDAEIPYRWALDPAWVARWHAATVWAFCLLLAAGLVLLHRRPTEPLLDGARRAWWWLLALTLAQGVIGYVQYFTGLPEVVVGLHMLGAGLFIVPLTYAVARLRPRVPVGDRS